MATRKKYVSRPKTVARRSKPSTGQFSIMECGQKAAHVCAICEEGGDLLFCDGPCMRHFHRTNVSKGAANFDCPGLLVPPLTPGDWQCPDCHLRQAMCFSCGLVGSFEGVDGGAPLVRQCPDHLCIRFFCFTCLPAEKDACPLHWCDACHRTESPTISGMVHCLRCPTAWHIPCLKKKQDSGYCRHREIFQHTWNGHRRNMFYCHNHIVDPHLGTPIRNHVTTAIIATRGAE
jgi:hypothetical protein